MRWLKLAQTFLAPTLLTFLLVACDVPANTPGPSGPSGPSGPVLSTTPGSAIDTNELTVVVRAVQPAAVEECRRRTRGVNCNFLIVINPDPRAEANAFQSVDDQGRPVLTFTAALIGKVRNPDELAFILGHEAAHHIAGHLARRAQNAAAGAAVFAGLATLTGGNATDVENAQKLGAVVGARSYSKEFEIEVDELGTLITHRAGYNPLIGAAFFSTLPDPKARFFGTHPPNSERYNAVRRASARLGVQG